MSRRKKKTSFVDIPTVEIKLSKDEIMKDIKKHSIFQYPAFSKLISILSEKKVKHIICLGIGDICTDINARKQLAFVVKICEKLSCSMSFFDPITCSSCLDFISTTYDFIKIEREDKIGKYSTDEGCIIGFHLPFFLLNNIVCNNLSKEKIKNFIFIGN